LEIRLRDLKPYFFLMAFFPATCELLVIAVYGHLALDFSRTEGLVLGVVLVSIGDGLVIPKMKEFGLVFKGHPLPRLMFCWAPLEASFCLTLFGVLVGLAEPANAPTVDMKVVVFANILRIIATVTVGAVMGCASGWLVSRRTKLTLNGQQIFTGTSVESFLMIVAVALVAFGLGSTENGEALVPMGFSFGSLFQKELLVIVMGTCFAAVADEKILHEVEDVMGGLWVFGQLVLFGMLGSRTSLSIFPKLVNILPIMAVGLTARFVGIVLSVGASLHLGLAGHPFQRATFIPDVLFCFLSTIPRATIQGALGFVPVSQGFFQKSPNRLHVEAFISVAARLYIFCTSIGGMFLLNHFGTAICTETADRPPWDANKNHAVGFEPLDTGLENFDPNGKAEPEVTWANNVLAAMSLLAREYDVDPETVASAMRRAVALERRPSDLGVDDLPLDLESFDHGSQSSVRTPMSRLGYGLTFKQFECMGELMKEARAHDLYNKYPWLHEITAL